MDIDLNGYDSYEAAYEGRADERTTSSTGSGTVSLDLSLLTVGPPRSVPSFTSRCTAWLP